MAHWGRWAARSGGWSVAAAIMVVLGSCGDSTTVGPTPDPAVGAFVGTWHATTFEITSVADPDLQFDILAGGSFTIVVEPSGQYTATLDMEGLPVPGVEFGQMTVDGSTLTLTPDGGPVAVSDYLFDGPDRVTLEGPTEFDVNRDGELDEATALIVLERS